MQILLHYAYNVVYFLLYSNDKDGNSVYDDIILLSYGELTDIQDIVFEIEKLQTPEILEYRDNRYTTMMKRLIKDQVIENICKEVYGEEFKTT